ncbi:SGNH/GDSL hydrolase family protein [Domibacillus mangrovi]|uniref:GDSL family lipase n=1 Tax=Domibacillus mangrovi TaxID=1714354 RepID=A0A1Q5P6L2_9BACI|nr:SGNH/GDSL hydrolase family protein [Domibacillus mangrovi]OKL37909.1 GDSL family lipase [Domibacillus mangrovi]
MKRTLAGLFLVASMTGCGNTAEETVVPVPQNIKIVSVGDSLTEGVGDSTGSGGYVPYLERKLESLHEIKDVKFSNYGKKGNRTDQLLKEVQKDEMKADIAEADIVMITIGGNDVVKVVKENWSHLTIDNFEEEEAGYGKRIRAILAEIRKQNEDAGIVLVGIYNPFGKIFVETEDDEEIISSWNETGKLAAARFDRTTFVSIENIFSKGSEELFFEDQFHPNDLGYKQIADRIFDTIKGEELEQLTNQKMVFTNEGSH